jgi:hypothetical protein
MKNKLPVESEMRSEYSFDFSKAKRNPYAARLKGKVIAVVLDPDVAAAFPTSEAVNAQLRRTLAARSRTRRASPVKRRASR